MQYLGYSYTKHYLFIWNSDLAVSPEFCLVTLPLDYTEYDFIIKIIIKTEELKFSLETWGWVCRL